MVRVLVGVLDGRRGWRAEQVLPLDVWRLVASHCHDPRAVIAASQVSPQFRRVWAEQWHRVASPHVWHDLTQAKVDAAGGSLLLPSNSHWRFVESILQRPRPAFPPDAFLIGIVGASNVVLDFNGHWMRFWAREPGVLDVPVGVAMRRSHCVRIFDSTGACRTRRCVPEEVCSFTGEKCYGVHIQCWMWDHTEVLSRRAFVPSLNDNIPRPARPPPRPKRVRPPVDSRRQLQRQSRGSVRSNHR